MKKNRTFHKRKVWTVFLLCAAMMLGLAGRLVYLMGFRSDYYYQKAQDLHERERSIKAARGKILDARGKVLASNKTVCTVSVIHSQIKEPEKIISLLSQKLELSEESIRKKVEKVSSIERIKTNVDKAVGDEIRKTGLSGVGVVQTRRGILHCRRCCREFQSPHGVGVVQTNAIICSMVARTCFNHLAV